MPLFMFIILWGGASKYQVSSTLYGNVSAVGVQIVIAILRCRAAPFGVERRIQFHLSSVLNTARYGRRRPLLAVDGRSMP